MLATGLGDHDPEEAYKVHLLTGERSEDEHRTMIASYVETAREVVQMNPLAFFSKFGEASRVIRHVNGSPDEVGLKIFELYRRHTQQVSNVVQDAIKAHAVEIFNRSLPPSCLLRMVVDSHPQPRPATASPTEISAALHPDQVGNSPGFIFQKNGEVWKIRYDGGRENILSPSKGAAYLHVLLSNPGTEFSASDLFFIVAKEPDRYQLGDAGEHLDSRAMAEYERHFKGLAEEMREARDNNDLATQDRLEREMEVIAAEVTRAKGLGGRSRKASDPRERFRKSVGNAVSRTLQKIAQWDARLAEHLKSPRLRMGMHPCYDPGSEIPWQT